MTGFNQTGQIRNEAGAGRGMGPCGGGRRRQGSGAGRGMGRTQLEATGNNQMMQTDPASDERTMLVQEAEVLERKLADVRKRLDTINKAE